LNALIFIINSISKTKKLSSKVLAKRCKIRLD
jgi:hypothetical protein